MDAADGIGIDRLQRGPEVRRGLNQLPDLFAAPSRLAGRPDLLARRTRHGFAGGVLRPGGRSRLRLLFLFRLAGGHARTRAEQALFDLVKRQREVGEHAVHVETDSEGHSSARHRQGVVAAAIAGTRSESRWSRNH